MQGTLTLTKCVDSWGVPLGDSKALPLLNDQQHMLEEFDTSAVCRSVMEGPNFPLTFSALYDAASPLSLMFDAWAVHKIGVFSTRSGVFTELVPNDKAEPYQSETVCISLTTDDGLQKDTSVSVAVNMEFGLLRSCLQQACLNHSFVFMCCKFVWVAQLRNGFPTFNLFVPVWTGVQHGIISTAHFTWQERNA